MIYFYRVLFLLCPTALSGIVFCIGYHIAKTWVTERETAATLTVLSGLLTALAILVPLLAATSSWSRSTNLRWWLLLGVLSTGVVGVFGTIYCMIRVQGYDKFTPSEKPYIPAAISGTWVCLLLLGVCVVASTFAPGAGEANISSPNLSKRARFAVLRDDLPELGADRKKNRGRMGVSRAPRRSERCL